MNKLLTTSVIALSTAIALSGCQKRNESEQKTTVAAPTAQTEQVQAEGDIIVKKEKAKYTLPVCEGKDCNEVDIQRLETNKPWINQVLDKEILTLSNLQFSEEVPKPTTIQANIDRFLASAKQDTIARGQPVVYSLQVDPDFLGQRGDIASFKIITAYYTGGAHGGASDNYYNFDLKQQKLLKLNDIVLPDQQKALHDLVYGQFIAWVKKNDAKVDLAEYEKLWPFQLNNNFSFTDNGLLFSYGQYEIGPYVVGMPEFIVPYQQLNGILKPQYMVAPTTDTANDNAKSSTD